MKFAFTKAIAFDGPDGMPRKAAAGDVITAEDISTGCLESCLRCGHLVEHIEGREEPIVAESTEPPSEAPKDEKPAKGKKKAKKAKDEEREPDEITPDNLFDANE